MGHKLSEILGVASKIDPDAYVIGTYVGDAIDMSKFDRVVGIVSVGDMETGATVDYQLTGSTSSGGSYALISGKAITQLTKAGTDDNKQAIVELTAMEVKAAGYKFVKETLIVLGSTTDADSVVLAYRPRYGPVTDNDLASVDEIV